MKTLIFATILSAISKTISDADRPSVPISTFGCTSNIVFIINFVSFNCNAKVQQYNRRRRVFFFANFDTTRDYLMGDVCIFVHSEYFGIFDNGKTIDKVSVLVEALELWAKIGAGRRIRIICVYGIASQQLVDLRVTHFCFFFFFRIKSRVENDEARTREESVGREEIGQDRFDASQVPTVGYSSPVGYFSGGINERVPGYNSSLAKHL